MKRTLTSLAAMAAAGAASAQTSVTLFGVVDARQPPDDPHPAFMQLTRQQIVETVLRGMQELHDEANDAGHFRTPTRAPTINLQPWQEDIARHMREYLREHPVVYLPWTGIV